MTDIAFRSVNPATEEGLESFPAHTPAGVEAILAAVTVAGKAWRARPVADRCALVRSVGSALRSKSAVYAAAITAEMGKPITEARDEVEKCAVTCDYYADHAEQFLANQPAPSDSRNSFISYAPLGTVLAVMPWNFPLWQVIRFAAPALCAGNTAILKHAASVTRCAFLLEELFASAGVPDVFRAVLIPNEGVGDLIADPRIAAITLTGSEAAGSAVASAAGRHLKKTVLELGGSDPFIVLDDADVEGAARTAVKARFLNCGQSCIAAKRFIVTQAVADAFEEALVAATRALRVGDPSREETQLGPLARDDLRTGVERQIRSSVSAGARVACGGERHGERGYFLQPTVLLDCTAGMTVMTEETFGPVAPVIRVADDRAAVAVANSSDFGLGGNIWTSDVERGVELAQALDCGGVFVNGMTHSDARLPFGGVKRSGYGRELHEYGIREFVNVKTIWRP